MYCGKRGARRFHIQQPRLTTDFAFSSYPEPSYERY